MKKKMTPELLKEEAKKFKRLLEYSFYVDDKLDEADDTPDSEEDEKVPDANTNNGQDQNAGSEDAGGEDDDMFNFDDGSDGDAGQSGTPPANPPAPAAPAAPAAPPVAPVDDSVDIDVTDLVHGSKEATIAAKSASHKSSELLMKLNDLEQRVDRMSSLGNKIDNLEREVVKRNPTPVEKLEMRSLSSYPYNIKLSDYWNDVDGYETGEELHEPKQQKDYVLKKSDVNGEYGDIALKRSFDQPEYDEDEV